jgi:ribosomal protein S18 acetylase RimI-like enzyme
MAEVAIRPARAEDVASLLTLWQTTASGPSVTDTPEHLAMIIEQTPDLFLVAECEGRLVGSVFGGWDLWRGNIHRLAVDPHFQRQGVARRLVSGIEAALRRRGATRINAIAYNREAALAFWRAAGYDETDTVVFARTLEDPSSDGQ